jgi:hypothetical protein
MHANGSEIPAPPNPSLVWLFDVIADPLEFNNVATEYPDIVWFFGATDGDFAGGIVAGSAGGVQCLAHRPARPALGSEVCRDPLIAGRHCTEHVPRTLTHQHGLHGCLSIE